MKRSNYRIPLTGWSPLHLYTHADEWINEALVAKLSICVKVTTSKAKTKLLVEGIGRSCCQTAPPGQFYWCSSQSVARSPCNGGIWNIRQPDNCTSGKGQILFKLDYGFRSPWMCFVLCCQLGEKVDAIPFVSLNMHFRKQKSKLCSNTSLITKIRSRHVAPFWKRILYILKYPPKQLNHIHVLSFHCFIFDGFPKLPETNFNERSKCAMSNKNIINETNWFDEGIKAYLMLHSFIKDLKTF